MLFPVTEITRRIAARYFARRAQELYAAGEYAEGDALAQEAARLQRNDEHTQRTWQREYQLERRDRERLRAAN